MKLGGRVWKLDRDLSVFDLLPARYDELGVNAKWGECARHLLEEVEPRFAAEREPGDIVIAGGNLGAGHAHYYRATIFACKTAAIGALLGEATNDLFQRGSIDQGLPVWAYPGIGGMAATGDFLEMDLATGKSRNRTSGETTHLKPLSPVILDILGAGGAFAWAKTRATAKRANLAPR